MVNLRVVFVPIVDMRLKFNLGTVSYDSFTVAIVLNIGNRVMDVALDVALDVVTDVVTGVVVDAVSDVITLAPEQLRPVPEFNSGIATDHLLAIGAVGDRMLILVDIEKLICSEEMGLVEQTLQ